MSENRAPVVVGDDERCPCTSGQTYGRCCGPAHRGRPAATAQALMRSRYSAFALGDADYLHRTWDPATRPERVELDDDIRWYRLDIVTTTGGGPQDEVGTVEFTARYRPAPGTDAPRGAQHENSRFRRLEGQWYYLDGVAYSF